MCSRVCGRPRHTLAQCLLCLSPGHQKGCRADSAVVRRASAAIHRGHGRRGALRELRRVPRNGTCATSRTLYKLPEARHRERASLRASALSTAVRRRAISRPTMSDQTYEVVSSPSGEPTAHRPPPSENATGGAGASCHPPSVCDRPAQLTERSRSLGRYYRSVARFSLSRRAPMHGIQAE